MGTLQPPAGRPIFYGHSGSDRITLMCYDDGAFGILRSNEEAVRMWGAEDAEACFRTFLGALDRPAKIIRRVGAPRAEFVCERPPLAAASGAPDRRLSPIHQPARPAADKAQSRLENLEKTLAAAPTAHRFAMLARIDLARSGPACEPVISFPKAHPSRAARSRSGPYVRLHAG